MTVDKRLRIVLDQRFRGLAVRMIHDLRNPERMGIDLTRILRAGVEHPHHREDDHSQIGNQERVLKSKPQSSQEPGHQYSNLSPLSSRKLTMVAKSTSTNRHTAT